MITSLPVVRSSDNTNMTLRKNERLTLAMSMMRFACSRVRVFACSVGDAGWSQGVFAVPVGGRFRRATGAARFGGVGVRIQGGEAAARPGCAPAQGTHADPHRATDQVGALGTGNMACRGAVALPTAHNAHTNVAPGPSENGFRR